MTPSKFLTELWGTAPPGKVLIWTAPPKRSYWYTQYANLDDNVAKLAETTNVYTGIGLAASNARVSERNRVKSNNIAAIAGLWSDIDISHPVHKKQHLAPSIEAATEALDTLYYTPTLLVNSGHGLQAWWLFDQPWVFASDDQRTQAQAASQWWHHQIQHLMQKEGWAIDATHDLARVMRLPGTFNRKDDEPVPVTVISQEGPRYDRQEFLDRLPDSFRAVNPAPARAPQHHPSNSTGPSTPSKATPRTITANNGLILSPDANPPSLKLEALLEHDPRFRATWQAKRSDFESKSPSEYDFALVSMALRANWTDQEVVDLIIAWRTKHRHDLKLRSSYYVTTLEKAKLSIEQTDEQTEAQDRLESAIYMPPASPNGPEIVESLTAIFNIGIRRIVKYEGDPPTYSMFTERGYITIGQIGSITSQIQFRNTVAAATGVLIPKCKEKTWEQRAQAILRACETVNMGDSSHPSEETLTWLHDYLGERPPCGSIEEAITTKIPFFHNNATYIFLDNFRRWVEFASDTRLTAHAMGQRLTNCGAMAEAIPITVGHKRTTRSCWRLAEKAH